MKNKELNTDILERNKAINARVMSLMTKHGMKKYALSKKINFSESALSKIFSGKSFFGLDPLVSISKLFNVSLDYLIFGRESDNEERLRKENELLANQLTEYKNTAKTLKEAMIKLLSSKHISGVNTEVSTIEFIENK